MLNNKYEVKTNFQRVMFKVFCWFNTNWVLLEWNWNSSNRHYQNLHHLEYIIYVLLEIKEQINDWDANLFSVFYHDIIYKATSKKNEELSAEFAKERLKKL